MKTTTNFSKKSTLSTIILIILINLNFYSQTLIFEDFEDSTIGYILKDESNGGTLFNEDVSQSFADEDYFGRLGLANLDNATDKLDFSGFNGTLFFGANDFDSVDSYPVSRDIVSLNWNNITITTSTTLKISGLFAEGHSHDRNEDWDTTGNFTRVRIQYSFNNTTWFNVFSIVGDDQNSDPIDTTNVNPVLDSNNDGAGDVPKVIINESFTNLAGTFDTGDNTNVHIRILMENLTGTDEDIAFDDFKVEVAAPADTTPPTVSSISVNGSPASNTTSLNYNITFSEDVTGLDTTDFSLDGSGVTGNITNISGSGSNYLVTVGSVSGTGTLSIDLNSSGTNIIDASGNAITSGFTAGATHSVDTVAPTASSISVNGSPTANATSISYNVVFNEDVTGVDTSDFSVDGAGVTGTITNVTGSGSSYIVTVGSVSGTGALSIDLNASGTNITDASSNAISGGFTAGGTHTVDTISPTLTASTPSDNATGVLINQNIELTFSENVSKGSGSITIRKNSDNSIFETINIAGALVSVSSNVVTINPANDFELNTMYYLQIDNTAFLDAANNNYLGFSDNATLNFTSEANQINTFVPFSGNWSNTSNWSLGRIPVSTDNITVDTGKTLTVNVASATVNNLTINISGSLNLLSGNALTVNGDLSQNGTFNILNL